MRLTWPSSLKTYHNYKAYPPRKRCENLRDSFFIVVAEVAGDGDTTRDSRLRLGRATTDARLARGLPPPDDITGWECLRLRAAFGFVALLGR